MAGYRPAWDDGRINPDRGLTPAALVTPQAVAPAGRFVQVGTYREPANAARAAANLESMGYSVAFQSVSRNGVSMRAVAAGPFVSVADLNAALRAARAAGYTDAFIR